MNLSNVFNFIKENAFIIGPVLLVLGIIAIVLITKKQKKPKDAQNGSAKTNQAAAPPPAKITIKEIGIYVLIISVLAAVTLPAFTVYVWLEGFQTNFHISFIFSALFFILAEIMMIKIYNEKAELEQRAWEGLNDWKKALAVEAHLGMGKTVKKFQEVYKDSIWVKYTPPYALVSYLIITSIGLTIFIYNFDRLVEAMGWSYALSLAMLLGFVVINLNIKFINDIYNLIKKYRQAKELIAQLNLSEN